MKRYASLLLGAVLLFAFASCGGKGRDASVQGAEAGQEAGIYKDFRVSSGHIMAEPVFDTAESFYYLCGYNRGKLWVSDKESREWLPLCPRPECMHRTSDCSAYLEGNYCGCKIWPCGDRLYYIIDDVNEDSGNPKLWRMKLDGSEHEKVLDLHPDGIDTSVVSSSWDWFFQGKYALLVYKTSSDPGLFEGGDDYYCATYTVDLSAESPEQKRLAFDEWMPFGTPYAGDGDVLYGVDFSPDPDGVNHVIRFDISKQSKETLCELPFRPGLYSGDLREGRLWLCDGTETGMIASVDIATGDLEIMEAVLPTGSSYFMSGGMIIGTAGNETRFFSLRGAPVLTLSSAEEIGIVRIVGDIVFGYSSSGGAEAPLLGPPEWYLDLSDVGTEELGWKHWDN